MWRGSMLKTFVPSISSLSANSCVVDSVDTHAVSKAPVTDTIITAAGPQRLRGRIEEWSAPRLEAIWHEWHALAEEGKVFGPFFQPEWFSPYLLAFEAGNSPLLLTVRNQRSLRGILPLVRTNRFYKGVPARTLRGVSSIHSARFDLIHAPVDRDEVVEEAWRQIRCMGHWDVFAALNVPQGGALEQVAHHAKRDGYLVIMREGRSSPYLELPFDGDPMVNCPKRGKHFRADLRRKENRLAKQGIISFRVTNAAEQTELEAFYRLEGAGWKKRSRSAIALHPHLIDFYSSAARAAATRGCFRMYSLLLNGVEIAMQYGFRSGDGYYACKITFDETCAVNSPGQILVKYIISDLVGEGVRRYDLLGHRSYWKSMWTATELRHTDIYIFKSSIIGRLCHVGMGYIAPVLRTARLRWMGGLNGKP